VYGSRMTFVEMVSRRVGDTFECPHLFLGWFPLGSLERLSYVGIVHPGAQMVQNIQDAA
jgi:hypothetical protein